MNTLTPRVRARPKSVILMDWAVNLEDFAETSDEAMYRLLLASLFYDEVIIPDEFFALSDKFASWFRKKDKGPLWEELLETGAFTILKLPLGAYPKALKSMAEEQPLTARATYIKRQGTKWTSEFDPSSDQAALYKHLDRMLTNRSNLSGRESGRTGPNSSLNIMQHFNYKLLTVLTSKDYEPWINMKFNEKLPQPVVKRFVNFLQNPSALKTEHPNFKYSLDDHGVPTTNRSFAYQAASVSGDSVQQKALESIVQSTFAAAMGKRENALPQIGRGMHVVPNLSTDYGHLDPARLVSFIAPEINVSILLPQIKPGFGAVLSKVRDSGAGRRLRASSPFDQRHDALDRQADLWRSVAHELAKELQGIGKKRNIKLSQVAGAADVAGNIVIFVTTGDIKPLEQISRNGVDDVLSLASEGVSKCWSYLKTRELANRIESTLRLQCSWIEDDD